MEGKLRPIVKSPDGVWRGTLTNKPNGWRIKHPDEGSIEGEDLIPIRHDDEPAHTPTADCRCEDCIAYDASSPL